MNIIKNDTKVFQISDYGNVSFEEINKKTNIDINSFKSNWVKLGDKYYSFKEMFDEFQLIQELLGEELTKAFGLRSIHYEISRCGDKVGLLSENFRNIDAKYFGMERFNIIRDFAIGQTNLKPIKMMRSDLQLDVLKLIVRDFYANQRDRINTNLLFENIGGEVRLAPLFDYENSFDNENDLIYYSGIGMLYISDAYLWFRKYPKLKDELLKILLLDMRAMLTNIKEYYGINIPNDINDNLIDFDKTRKEIVKVYIKQLKHYL